MLSAKLQVYKGEFPVACAHALSYRALPWRAVSRSTRRADVVHVGTPAGLDYEDTLPA